MAHDSEDEAYAYAYNEGHAGSRKGEPYKPNPTTKEGSDFKKIYKQRAETFEADADFQGQDSCVVCGEWEIPLSEMDGGEEGLTDYFFSCANCNWSWYVAIRTDEHEEGMSVSTEPAGWFYGERGACDGCHLCDDDEEYHLKIIEATERKAETFEADWRDLSRDSSGRWEKSSSDDEMQSYITGAQYRRPSQQTNESNITMMQLGNLLGKKLGRSNGGHLYISNKHGRGWTKEHDRKRFIIDLLSSDDSQSQRKALQLELSRYPDYDPSSRTFAYETDRGHSQSEMQDEALDLDELTELYHQKKIEAVTESEYITIRDLASKMNDMTGELLGFAESRNTVIEMLGGHDTTERREALYSTIEECIMTMNNNDETGYEGDIQVLVDIMRDTGIAPPPNFEEKVMARYQFENTYAAESQWEAFMDPRSTAEEIHEHYIYVGSEWAAQEEAEKFLRFNKPDDEIYRYIVELESDGRWLMSYQQVQHFAPLDESMALGAEGKKILQPTVPADYNINETFGNNMILMSEEEHCVICNHYGHMSQDCTHDSLECKCCPCEENCQIFCTCSASAPHIDFESEDIPDRNSTAYEEWQEKSEYCLHDWQDDKLEIDGKGYKRNYSIIAYCPTCNTTVLIIYIHAEGGKTESIYKYGKRSAIDFYDNSPPVALAGQYDF